MNTTFTTKQRAACNSILRREYCIPRQQALSDAEILAEIKSTVRKQSMGTLDDIGERLFAEFQQLGMLS